MAVTGRVLNEMCSSRICIDKYCNGDMSGRIYNNYFSEPILFQNAVQMLKKLDAMYDVFEYPQKTLEDRVFFENVKKDELAQTVLNQPNPQEARGEMATFYVKVVFRKNATWQGSIIWIDQNKEENFRSVMELLMLLDNALCVQE